MESGIYVLPVYCIRELSEATRISLLHKVFVVLHNKLTHIFNFLWTVLVSENEIPVPAIHQMKFGCKVTCLPLIGKPRNLNLT
jgi:hypothetical protein